MDLRDKLIKLYERQIELQEKFIAQKEREIDQLRGELMAEKLNKPYESPPFDYTVTSGWPGEKEK